MKYKIPGLPISALLFYLGAVILWTLNIIPPPSQIFLFLESLYNDYGLVALFLASFIEGIVYVGLYFVGSFIIALAVFISDGSFTSFITISFLVSIALTLSSLVNYIFGRYILSRKEERKEIIEEYKQRDKNVLSKGLFLSMLHPNSLAFYFFNAGIKKRNPLKILIVPLVILPYGFFLSNMLYLFKDTLRTAIENPFMMMGIITLWLIVAILLNKK